MSQHSGAVWKCVVLQLQRERKIYQVDHLCGCPGKLLIFVRAWAYHVTGRTNFGISARTLLRRRHEYGMAVGDSRLYEISDAELDQIVEDCLVTTPNAEKRKSGNQLLI